MNYNNLCTWAEIDIDALENNFRVLSDYLPDDALRLAVIKADAYGHGAVYAAKFLEEKIDFFGVARADEGLELRNNGIKKDILILGYTPGSYYKTVIENNLTATVYSREDAAMLNRFCEELNTVATVHVALDTGMSRIGFDLSESSIEDIIYICSFNNLKVEGIFSHLANADDLSDGRFTVLQTERFKMFLTKLERRGVNIPIKHLHNSAGICSLTPDFTMSRMGICLYGYRPDTEFNACGVEKLRPVMSLKSQVIHIHEIEEGTPVSYNCTFISDKNMKVATVCAGYADGFPRMLSNKGHVLINGKRAKILGRVCMDQLMCDITDIEGVSVGDKVTLFGKDGDELISASEVAAHAMTNAYEVLCGISKRVPRVYIKDGKNYDIHYGISHDPSDN